MKSKWNKTIKSNYNFSMPTPGVYKATTKFGRVIYTYAESSESAVINFLSGMKWNDEITSMCRDNYKGEN